MEKEKRYSKSLVTVAVCISIAFFGISMYFWGAMLPIVRSQIEGVDSLPWILTLGIIIGTIVCGTFMDRYGYKWLLLLSCFAIGVGLLIFSFSRDFYLCILSVLLIGGGGGVLNSETIAIISDLYDDSKRGMMLGILGGTYCLGSLLWTLICRLWSDNPTIPIIGSSILILLVTLLILFVKFPPAKVKQGEGLSFINILKLFKHEVLVVVSLVLFFQGIVEAISANFSTSYLTSYSDMSGISGGITSKQAISALIFMTVGMTIGRFSLSLFLKYLGNFTSLILFLAVAFVGALIQKFFPTNLTASILSMGFLGFGVGATSPIAFNYLGQIFKKYSGIAVSVVVMVAQLGMLVGNYFVGKLFYPNNLESGAFKSFPIIMAIAIVIVVALFPLIIKSVKNHRSELSDI